VVVRVAYLGPIRVFAIVLGSCLFLLVACTSGPSPGGGRATREEVVTAYLDALRRGDGSAITALLVPGLNAGPEVASALATNGGIVLEAPTIAWLDEFGGIYQVATVGGTSAGEPRQIQIPVSRVGGRYFLAIGSAALPSGPVTNPASPQPASS
jgi:hypothetical protein